MVDPSRTLSIEYQEAEDDGDFDEILRMASDEELFGSAMNQLQVLDTPSMEQCDTAPLTSIDPDRSTDTTCKKHTLARNQLFLFFDERLENPDWKDIWGPRKRLPKEKKDPQFDELLTSLKVDKVYAGRQWRVYKEKKGIHGKIEYTTTKQVLFSELESTVNSSEIVDHAILATLSDIRKSLVPSTEYNRFQVDFLETTFSNLSLIESAKKRISELNNQVSTMMYKLTPSSLDSRVLTFEIALQDAGRLFADEKAIPLVSSQGQEAITIERLRQWFIRLHMKIVDTWTRAIQETTQDHVFSGDVPEDEISSILRDSRGTVYFLAGWLLMKIKKRKRKRSAEIESIFLDYNTLDKGNPSETNLPDAVLEVREIQKGKLQRPGKSFFDFVSSVEALYTINLTPAAALAFKGMLFSKLDDFVKKAPMVKELYRKCIPPSCTMEDASMLEDLFGFFLQKYSRMRARDALKKIKARAITSTVGDGFSTRTAVQAVELAAAARKPSALQNKDIINE